MTSMTHAQENSGETGPKSLELFERSLKLAPGGVHSPVRAFKSVEGKPIFFESAHGAYLKSVDGKEYIDYCQSFGPLILGHRDPDVAKVVRDTVEKAWTFGTCEPYSVALADWITSKLPWVEKIRFVCSGTEAVMTALRLARAATRRDKILKFEGCYHGHTDSLLVKAGSGLAGESVTDSAGVSEAQASETLTVPLNDEAALERAFSAHGKEIAAVIIEPLPANNGLLIQRAEFIQSVAKMTRAHGALLIFDEVISGFRVALGGMVEITGIKPDLVTYGKVIGGGFPVGAYGGRKDLLDMIAPNGPVYQAGTLSANPFGMRAGFATLQKAQSQNVYTKLSALTSGMAKEFNKLAEQNNVPLVMSSYASLFWIHGKSETSLRAIGDIPSGHKSNFNKLFHRMLAEGVYLAPSAYEVGFLSLAHDEKVVSETINAFGRALKNF